MHSDLGAVSGKPLSPQLKEEAFMDLRTRFIRALSFDRSVSPLFWHMYGLMPGTLERWKLEGLPGWVEEEDVSGYFGFDPQGVRLPFPVGFDPPFEVRVLEETSRFVIKTDEMGRVTKLMKGITTLPQAIDHPIKRPSDWNRLRDRLRFSENRVKTDEWARLFEKARAEGLPVAIGCKGFFWFPRDLMGEFFLLKAYYRRPELVHDILRTYCDLIIEVSERLLENFEIDHFEFSEDMCYRHGPMISPRIFREFMLPYYREVVRLFRSRGTAIFSVDTDGSVEALIPLLIEAGVNVIFPLEVQAGNDVVSLRGKFGEKMAFIGGLDKRVLLRGFEEIDRELTTKLAFMKKAGGYIAGLDHRVLSQTPLENFRYYVERAKEILDVP
jgi:uroporphyrinogen decarboxylase